MVETTRSLEDIDALLQRNWFFNREDVIDLLYLATEEDWQWIIENCRKYDSSIQDIICHEAGLPKIKTNLRIRDLSDNEYNQFLLDSEQQSIMLVDKRWKEYKVVNNIHPPPSYYEKELSILNDNYEKELKAYSKYGADKNAISIRIQNLKNGIENLQDKIIQHNKDWDFLAKSEFRINGTLSKLPEEESYCSNM